MKITISTGKSRKETRWKIKTVEWSVLVDKLRTTQRTSETVADYKAATKDRRAELKDVGGFVGGAVEGGRRIRGSVRKRSLLTLDMDYASVGVWDDITLTLDCTMVLYSTHSHTPENPRYRLVIPLNREVDVEEHEAIARKVASMIGINMFDDSTYQAERLMYYPSTSKDGEYVFEYREGEPLDADKVLAEYHDWRDVSQWAVSERVSSLIRHEMRKKGDPNDRPGMVGAFCRSYTIAEAIDQFLSDVYAPVPNDDNRYTYINGSSAGGLVIYNDVFAYSHHATDPAGEQLSNAFDLVRIHMFGAMDSGVSSNTPINKLPSFVEMERFASSDAKVRQNFNADISERLRSDFGDLYDNPDLDDDATTEAEDDDAWMENLTRTRTGQIENTVQNIILILENAKGLKGNLRTNNFKHSIEVKGNLPWRKINMTTEGEWTNADEARLQVYFERYYNLIGRPKILNCFTEVISAHSYHPVRDYLSSLEWDGVSRVDTLLTDYLGVPDTELNRAISRKFLVAAVARVFRPGIKFDYVTVIQGREGIGKSTLIRELASPEWFNDSLSDLSGKDAMEALQGSWIIEIGELTAIKRSEVEAIKSYISRQTDTFRPAYGRVRESYPRQCIFTATTNEEHFLKGLDGNRRFWIVSCTGEPTKNVFDVGLERDQIWAEAVHFYKQGERLYLPPHLEADMRVIQAEQNEITADERIGIIEAYLDKKLPVEWESMDVNSRVVYLADEVEIERRGAYERNKVCIAEIMVECFRERMSERTRQKSMMYAAMMRKIPGWRSCGNIRVVNYGVQRGYVRIGSEDDI